MVTLRPFIATRCVLILALVIALTTSCLYGQSVSASARVDSNTIPLGGGVSLHLEVRHPADATILWPPLGEALDGLEVVRQSDSSSERSGEEIIDRTSFVLTGFDSGTFYVPPLPFRYRVQGDTALQTAMTTAIPITVINVPVDTTRDLKDIKPPLGIPITFAELLPYLLGLAGLLLAGYLVYYFMKKRRLGERLIPQAPPRPPHEIALEALRSLDAENMWQRGKVKEYYSGLADIVRTYIEKRFRVIAMELTTGEILEGLRNTPVTPEATAKLKDVLVRADFVKFARYQPREEEHRESMAEAVAFVETTWSTPTPRQESPVETAGTGQAA